MVELAHVLPGEKMADLGTGDGRIAIAFREARTHVDAFELDDTLLSLAQQNAKNAGVSINFIQKDFWFENLSQYTIICCYPMPTIMGRLEKKLHEELKPGSRVLLNYFPFKHWKLETTKDNIFLYIK